MDFFRHLTPLRRAQRNALSFNALPVTHELGTKLFIRTMRLTGVLLLAFCLHVSARSDAQQRIAINVKNVSLQKLFGEIEKKTNYTFFYDVTILKETKPVTVAFKDATVEEILRQALVGQALEYTITDKTIFVKREKKVSVAEAVSLPDTPISGNIKVKGVVLTDAGVPAAGANITNKQTGKGTFTNAKGEFEMSSSALGCVLVFSYVGYAPQSFTIKDGSQIRIYLKVAQNELDKAVVQAYGLTTQRLTTADIGKVTAEEIERQPVMNLLLALEGKVAGLDIVQTNGFASAPIKVELRGRNSIGVNQSQTFPSDPLYVIDGVPLTVLDVGGGASYQYGSPGFLQVVSGPANGQSPFFSLNPADIESIEILKDADATAIYGSRGANGVILITTKRGKSGKTKLDLRVQEGTEKVTKFWQMMNTQQYLQMRREALFNDGITPSLSNGDYDLLQWDTARNVDWQRMLYGGIGKTIDAEGSLSGGNAQTIFRLGVGYNHTTNILTVSGADQRASVSLSLSHHSLDQRFSFLLSNTYSLTQSDMINLPSATTLSPDAPSIYDSLGNLNWGKWGVQGSRARNAFAFSNLLQPYTSKTNFLNTNFVITYQLAVGLKLNVSFGYSNAQANTSQYFLIASQDPLSNPLGSSQLSYNGNKNWIIEPHADYEVVLGKGRFNTLLGSSIQQTNTDALLINGYGFTSDQLIKNISNAANEFDNNVYGEYRYAAIYSRITYNWANKYIVNLNGRRDGSSRFGPGKQYGNFGSVGAAWIFSEENLVRQILPFLNFGKLRVNYGTTGSDAVGDYGYLTRWASSGSYPTYNGATTLAPTQFANPNFQWQVNKKLEGGLDLAILKSRVNFSLAYYRNRVGNQLIQFPTPAFSGFTGVTANSPALVQNDGWEFTGGAKIIQANKFIWSINFNIAVNRNKLVAYPNLANSPFASTLIVGKSLNIVNLLHYSGVDPQTGQYAFRDKNHDGIINYNPGQPGDDTYAYDRSPQFFGGVGTNISYNSFQVSLFFNFKKQIGINALAVGNIPGRAGINQPAAIAGREWKEPGDLAQYSRFSIFNNSNFSEFSYSDGRYTDASFIRLSNISISYGVPKSYVQKIGIQSCNIFFHTNNLFVITNYKGLDPETQNFGSMPPSKSIVGGISLSF